MFFLRVIQLELCVHVGCCLCILHALLNLAIRTTSLYAILIIKVNFIYLYLI